MQAGSTRHPPRCSLEPVTSLSLRPLVTSVPGTWILQHTLHPLRHFIFTFSLLGKWEEKFDPGPPHLVSVFLPSGVST